MTIRRALGISAADLFDTTLRWTESWFDPAMAAVWNPAGSFGEPATSRTIHLTPNSAWFAYGALLSGRPELHEPAVAALRRLLASQYDAPGQPWDGSFPRYLEAPPPGPGAREWVDYDPNWRQFVGITFATLLEDLADELEPSMAAELEVSIRHCVVGEPDGRIVPGYTNPALMRAWLDAWYGARVDDEELVTRGSSFGASVVELFDAHGAFDEFNSPTYYGIDLLALRLWQVFAPTPWFGEQGARLEAAIWESAARFFNPALGTFAGPFTRAYTPDARRGVTLMALWVWADAGRDAAPLPDLDAESVDHGHDLMAGPLIARLYAPGSGGPRFVVAPGPRRRVEVALAERRIATEIQPRCSVGLESSPHDWGGWDQFMPVVVQWVDGGVGLPDEVQVLWLARPGVVVGELTAEDGVDGATIELDVGGAASIELLTYAPAEVIGAGAVRLGRYAGLTASRGGLPTALRTEPAGPDLTRVVVPVVAPGSPGEGAGDSVTERLHLVFTVGVAAS